jgi:hypothetical protein
MFYLSYFVYILFLTLLIADFCPSSNFGTFYGHIYVFVSFSSFLACILQPTSDLILSLAGKKLANILCSHNTGEHIKLSDEILFGAIYSSATIYYILVKCQLSIMETICILLVL